MYCKCGTTVHPVRIELGYKTCVNCSTTKTYSYVPIIEHKTGNTIQIVSQEVSASVHRAWRRKQYSITDCRVINCMHGGSPTLNA